MIHHECVVSFPGLRGSLIVLAGLLVCAATPRAAWAQAESAKPGPDVLILVNGDKLTGQIENTTGASIALKSDMAGEVTVDWSKVKEVQSSREFAVVPKGVVLKRKGNTEKVPQGTLQLEGKTLDIKPAKGGPEQPVATDNIANVLDEPSFTKAVTRRPAFTEDWVGAIALGTTLVEATQKSNTISGSVNLVRAVPSESWLLPENRTIFGFNAAYGKVTQPNTPTVKTDLWHLGLERDEYLTPRIFAFVSSAYDHNFSQGLDLQQTYGGGLGWTVIKDPIQELDLKVGVNYIRQSFAVSSQNQNLIGSSFGEDYVRKLMHGVVFTEGGTFIPAWNNTNAYSATAQAGLAFPLYKGFSLSVGALDTFLNNPPVGFKKNSFQFTTALGYAIK